jgi:hypothetical protein
MTVGALYIQLYLGVALATLLNLQAAACGVAEWVTPQQLHSLQLHRHCVG